MNGSGFRVPSIGIQMKITIITRIPSITANGLPTFFLKVLGVEQTSRSQKPQILHPHALKPESSNHKPVLGPHIINLYIDPLN